MFCCGFFGHCCLAFVSVFSPGMDHNKSFPIHDVWMSRAHTAKVHVFPDSVLCLATAAMNQAPENRRDEQMIIVLGHPKTRRTKWTVQCRIHAPCFQAERQSKSWAISRIWSVKRVTQHATPAQPKLFQIDSSLWALTFRSRSHGPLSGYSIWKPRSFLSKEQDEDTIG